MPEGLENPTNKGRDPRTPYAATRENSIERLGSRHAERKTAKRVQLKAALKRQSNKLARLRFQQKGAKYQGSSEQVGSDAADAGRGSKPGSLYYPK